MAGLTYLSRPFHKHILNEKVQKERLVFTAQACAQRIPYPINTPVFHLVPHVSSLGSKVEVTSQIRATNRIIFKCVTLSDCSPRLPLIKTEKQFSLGKMVSKNRPPPYR